MVLAIQEITFLKDTFLISFTYFDIGNAQLKHIYQSKTNFPLGLRSTNKIYLIFGNKILYNGS